MAKKLKRRHKFALQQLASVVSSIRFRVKSIHLNVEPFHTQNDPTDELFDKIRQNLCDAVDNMRRLANAPIVPDKKKRRKTRS